MRINIDNTKGVFLDPQRKLSTEVHIDRRCKRFKMRCMIYLG